MRFTAVLNSTHIGNAFKQVWKVQNKRKIFEYGVRSQLESKGIQVVDAVELLGLKPPAPTKIPQIPKIADGDLDESLLPRPTKFDSTHPDWHDEPCRIYHNSTILLTGLDEAANFTKASCVSDQLPERITSLRMPLSEGVHSQVKQAIMSANTLDAVQLKLPTNKFVDGRFNRATPRNYGLPKARQNDQLMTKLFHICDSFLISQNVDVTPVQMTREVKIRAPLQVDGQPVLFDLNVRQLMLGRQRLRPYVADAVKDQFLSQPLPSIYPLSRTISIREGNIYRLENKFPIIQGAPYGGLTMAVVHLNKMIIKQNQNQHQGRLLLQAFGMAAAYAQRLYGNDVADLPEPITINCLQCDSQNIIFGALQLHSLNLNGDDGQARNLFWMEKPIAMFEKCGYEGGRPVLEGYNPEAIETLMAVYRSQLVATQ